MEINNHSELVVLSDEELILKVKNLVKSERKIMHLVLLHIQEVETRKLYLKLGHASLYQYLTQELGYAENAAYDRMQAVKILKHSPEVATQIQAGSINLSQLVKVSACLKHEKKEGRNVSGEALGELLTKIENKTKFETEFVLSKTFDHVPEKNQKLKPQQDGSVVIQVTLSKEQYDLLKEAQSLVSHVVPDQNLAEVITYLAEMQIRKKLGKAEFAEEKATLHKIPSHEKPPRQRKQRKYISVHIKRRLLQKANRCCEFVNPETNQKCNSKYQLQIDHKVPIAFGGRDDLQNLRLLCGSHNRMEAEHMNRLL